MAEEVKSGRGKGRGRPITTRTKLGRLFNDRNLRVYTVCGHVDFGNRLMCEYINARRIIPEDHLQSLCDYFGVQAEEIVEEWLIESLTDSTGTRRSVKGTEDVARKREEVFGESTANIPARAHTGDVAPAMLRRAM